MNTNPYELQTQPLSIPPDLLLNQTNHPKNKVQAIKIVVDTDHSIQSDSISMSNNNIGDDKYHLNERNFSLDEGEDRLSSLPDSLLIEILGLLPFKSAVATSVLSRRWLPLWTHHTRLSFVCCDTIESCSCPSFGCCDPVESQGFVSTIKHILGQITSPKINSFSLTFPGQFGLLDPQVTQLCSDFFYDWIPRICARNPECLTVSLSLSGGAKVFGFDLPICVLQTESLVELTLSSRSSYFTFLDVDAICSLPNLKKLTMWLSLLNSQCKFLETLCKSCPLLGDLDLCLCHPEGDDDGSIFEIFAPNVKYLSLRLFNFDNSKFRIDAPKVECLKLKGGSASFDFVRSWSDLVDVKMSFSYPRWTKHCLTNIFHGVSSVRVLHLAGSSLSAFTDVKYEHDDDFPIFPNLVCLKITRPLDLDEVMILDDALPAFLLANVKRVQALKFQYRGINFRLIEYILRQATALEELSVSIEHTDASRKDQLWAEYRFCESLFMIRRSSSSCVIRFYGQFITASSNDFDKQLPCNLELYVRFLDTEITE